MNGKDHVGHAPKHVERHLALLHVRDVLRAANGAPEVAAGRQSDVAIDRRRDVRASEREDLIAATMVLPELPG
jgi:hypothetical protein